MKWAGECNIESLLGVCWSLRNRSQHLNTIHILYIKHIIHAIPTKYNTCAYLEFYEYMLAVLLETVCCYFM